jgi:hypothetical protein
MIAMKIGMTIKTKIGTTIGRPRDRLSILPNQHVDSYLFATSFFLHLVFFKIHYFHA